VAPELEWYVSHDVGQHDIKTAIEYLPRPRKWLSPLSASPAKMRAFYSGDDTMIEGQVETSIVRRKQDSAAHFET
jgi:hypothetical protein